MHNFTSMTQKHYRGVEGDSRTVTEKSDMCTYSKAIRLMKKFLEP